MFLFFFLQSSIKYISSFIFSSASLYDEKDEWAVDIRIFILYLCLGFYLILFLQLIFLNMLLVESLIQWTHFIYHLMLQRKCHVITFRSTRVWCCIIFCGWKKFSSSFSHLYSESSFIPHLFCLLSLSLAAYIYLFKKFRLLELLHFSLFSTRFGLFTLFSDSFVWKSDKMTFRIIVRLYVYDAMLHQLNIIFQFFYYWGVIEVYKDQN